MMTPSTNVAQPQSAARRQLEFLKRQLWLIVLVLCAALAIAAATSLAQKKVYRAKSLILVTSSGSLNPSLGPNVQPFTQTMSSLLNADIIARQVITDLGLNITTTDLLKNLHVASTPDSAALQVSYDSQDRGEAVRILADVGRVFTQRVHTQLGKPSGPNLPVVTAKVWNPATASSTPISPHPVRTLAFAGVIGLALGIALGLLRDTLDERIHKREEMEELFGAPVIAVLPRTMFGRPLVDSKTGADRARLHALDPLRLQLARDRARERLIAVTSGGSGQGQGAVAASLGLALALGGEDVVCVDVSPREKRSLSYYLNVRDADRQTAPIEGPHDIEHALREVPVESQSNGTGTALQIEDLATAAAPGKRGRLQLLSLNDGAFSGDNGLPAWSVVDLVTELKSEGRFIVVDAPSIPSAAAFALLSVSDRTLVVAQESRTTKEQATSARKALEALQVPEYGVVSIGRTATAVPPYGRAGGDSPRSVSSRRVRRAR